MRRCFLPPETWEMGCGAQFFEDGVRKHNSRIKCMYEAKGRPNNTFYWKL